jgi:hypothetical protein
MFCLLMPAERIELSTSGLQDHCSTTELSRPLNAIHKTKATIHVHTAAGVGGA